MSTPESHHLEDDELEAPRSEELTWVRVLRNGIAIVVVFAAMVEFKAAFYHPSSFHVAGFGISLSFLVALTTGIRPDRVLGEFITALLNSPW